MLLTPPSVLEKFDVPAPVLDVLSRSAVKHVSIVGRRGPYEAAFTTKELREMMNLPDASMTPVDPTLLQAPEGTTSTRQQERMIQLLRKGSKNPPGSTPKTWSFEFFRSPTGLARPSASTPATLTLAHTMLDPATRRAVSTSHTSTLDTSLVVTSLGHRAEPTQPWYDPALGHIRTLSGRVIDASGNALRGVYASGWAAMGARGVLASTLMDAYAVADTIISDSLPGKDILATTAVSSATALQRDPAYGAGGGTSLLAADPDPDSVPPAVEEGLRAGVVTTYEDWKLVDEQEVRSGNATDKERERMGWDEARAFLTRVKTAN